MPPGSHFLLLYIYSWPTSACWHLFDLTSFYQDEFEPNYWSDAWLFNRIDRKWFLYSTFLSEFLYYIICWLRTESRPTSLGVLLYIMPSGIVTAWLFTKTGTQRVFFLGLLPLVAPAPLFVVLSAWCHLLMGPFEVAEVERKVPLGLGSPACLELFNVGRSSRRLVQNIFLCLSSLSFISKHRPFDPV